MSALLYDNRAAHARAHAPLIAVVRAGSSSAHDVSRRTPKVYVERGQNALAETEAHRFLELAPGDPEGLQLLAAMSKTNGP